MDYRLINEIFGPKEGQRYASPCDAGAGTPYPAGRGAAARGEAGHFFLCLHEHREDAVIARLEIRADVNAFNAQRRRPII